MIGDRANSLLDLLVRINRDVVSALDLRMVLQRLVFASMQHVGGERGSIIVVNADGMPVDAMIVYGKDVHAHTTRRLQETVDRGLAGWVIRNRKPALLTDTSRDERWLHRPDDAVGMSGPKSAICVPLMARNQVVGALTIVHPVPGTFQTEHLELAQAIADQASIAVLNARLYSESRRQARIMTSLADSAVSFSDSLESPDTWERVLNRTVQTLQVETAALGFVDEAEGQVVFRAAAGQNAEGIVGHTLARDKGLVGETLKKGRAVVVENAPEEPRYAPADHFPGVTVRGLMLAPIASHGKFIGILAALNPVEGTFDQDAPTVMQGLAALAGITIRNAELLERLQHAQQHYLELFEESLDLVFVTDWNGRITEANRRAAEITGLSIEQLKAVGIAQIHPVDKEKVGKGFEGLRRRTGVQYESAVRTSDGTAVTVEVRARAMEFGAAEGILWTMHDLTERKKLDELRENLAAMIYHDLRSPISNLVSSLDLLHGMLGANDDAAVTLGIAQNSVGRINRLISSLLDINRLEAGLRITSQSLHRPEDLVLSAVREASPLAEARDHRIRTTIAAGLPDIWVDGDMIRRVLINLLENAIKFSGAGTDVELGALQDSGLMQFWVQDRGPGIPAADHWRIFEKFARLSSSSTTAQGIGLGLAFCRLAVRAHGGNIRVESEEGRGARFIVTLPLKAAAV